MEKEDKFFEQFKDKDHTSLERPSSQAWTRLSSKLDAAEGTTPKVVGLWSRYRWFGIAAGLIILVGAIGIINRGMNDLKVNGEMAMKASGPQELEDLEFSEPSGFYAIAIKTNQYYNISPSRLADANQESYSSRLQLKDRTTRSAKQPEYLASVTKKEVIKKSDSNKPIAMEAEKVEVLEESTGIQYDKRQEQLGEGKVAYQKSKVSKPAASKVVSKASEVADDAVRDHASEYNELDAKSNVITLSSNDIESSAVEQFNWLVGDWSANYGANKENQQVWSQKDAYTLVGNAVLTINGKSTSIEQMEIKKIGEEIYFIRVNTENGSTVKYQLKNVKRRAFVFENETLKDRIIIQQNSDNSFNNQLIQNRSMQMTQFPGTEETNIKFSRNKER